MDEKNNTIKTYKQEEIVKIFDTERSKYNFQKYKHLVESNFLKKTIKKIGKEKLKILDVACGTGRMLPEVFSTGKEIEYYGLDTSAEMTNVLKEKAKKMGKEKDVKIILDDATKIPFKDDTFDIVYSFHLLWHIEKEEQEKVIKEMLRVTKSGGKIVFDILNKNFVWEKAKIWVGKKKDEGLYKMSIQDIKKILGHAKKIEISKLSDAPIKNNYLYNIFNLLNKSDKFFPSFFYHMIFLRIEK